MQWRMVKKKIIFSQVSINYKGMEKSVSEASLGWLLFMGALYITGALFYAFRIPERFFPGKVDIWVGGHHFHFNDILLSLL